MGYIAPRHAGHICFGGGNACRYAPVSGPMVSIHAKSRGQNVLLEEGGGGYSGRLSGCDLGKHTAKWHLAL